jgi:voltage-gated potassium channel
MTRNEKLQLWKKHTIKFFKRTGLLYLIVISAFLLVVSSIVFSIVENTTIPKAFWWAIETTTTVGYGDIYPHTGLGKILAILLMLLGIGIIGMLTSTITNSFRPGQSSFERLENLENDIKDINKILKSHEEASDLLRDIASELHTTRKIVSKNIESDEEIK